jgi:hypothetical protein
MAYCDRCERSFTSDRALEQHKEDSDAHWPCDDCDLDFGSSYARDEHYRQSPNHHYCRDCDRLFNSEESKIQHMEAKHWYCRVHDRVSNSIATITTLACNEKLILSCTVDLQIKSRPTIALQTELRSPDSPHLRKVWVRL